jgi:two-component system, cell cycle sensor histidine kinase and response regulator CckA
LSATLGSVSLLRISETPFSDDDKESITTIEHAARCAADITGRLLSFARGELSRLAPVDLNDVITETMRFAKSSIPRQIRVLIDAPEEAVVVEGDATQLQQVLLNIILNACYVMPDGGELSIRLRAAGGEARLSVSDTGPGIDAATMERLFEPFFTTKPQGLGTGLGLPSAYGIVKGHKGTIDVDSTPGEGATFTIRLPLAASGAIPVESALAEARGSMILVVDDDAVVRRATLSMLEQLGVRGEAVATGEEAIDAVRAGPERWAAVVLDLVMPDVNGVEVFRRVNAIRKDLPVIISTGYTPERYLSDDDRRAIEAILHKPFTMDRLRSALASVGVQTAGAIREM